MLHWYVGPWRWVFDAFDGYHSWDRPEGTIGALDLRSKLQQGTAGGTPGMGIFVLSDPLRDSSYTLLGTGHWGDIKASQKLIDRLPRRSGFTPQGDDLYELILSCMTSGADPRGEEYCHPLTPSSDGKYGIRLAAAGLCERRKFVAGLGHWGIVRDLLRNCFSKQFDEAQAGLMRDAEQPRRVLDALCEKYGVEDWREFVPTALQKEITGRLEHATTYTDDFLRSNGAGLGANWSNMVQNGFDIESNQARGTNSTQAATRARYVSDVSTDDMEVDLRLISYGSAAGAACGTMARCGSSTDEWLSFNLRQTTTPRRRMQQFVSAVSTILASDDVAPTAAPCTLRTYINGSDIRAYIDGAEVTSLAATGNPLPGNLKGGMGGLQSPTVGNRTIFDDFQVQDIAVAPSILYTQLEKWTRGMRRGMWTRPGN